jgi:hypothetical protein
MPAVRQMMAATILCLYREEADKLWLVRLPSNWSRGGCGFARSSVAMDDPDCRQRMTLEEFVETAPMEPAC